MDELGRPRDLLLAGHEEVLLDDPDRCLVIEEGRVGVYLVEVRDGRPRGRRHYLFTRGKGELLLGAPTIQNGITLSLMLAPIGPTVLNQIAITRANEAMIRNGISDWGLTINQRLVDLCPEGFAESPESDHGELTLPPGIRFKARGSDLSLMRITTGKARLMGRPELTVSVDTGPLALISGFWFESGDIHDTRPAAAAEPDKPAEPARSTSIMVTFRPSGDDPAILAQATLGTTALFIGLSHLQILDEEAAEAERLTKLEKQRIAARGQAVKDLSFAARHDPLAGLLETEDPLTKCLYLMSRKIGFTLVVPKTLERQGPMTEQMAHIAHASGTRHRRVRLTGDWLLDDVGTLLAFRKTDQAPVVLMCESRTFGLTRYYAIFDPLTGTIEPAGMELYDQLEDHAFTFIAPLPNLQDGVSFWKMAKFAFAPVLTDLRLLAGLSLLGSLLGMILPIANYLVIDKVIPDANWWLLWELAVGMLVLSLGLFSFTFSKSLISLRVQTTLGARLQAAIIDRLLRLPNRFFQDHPSGELLKRAMMISEISTGITMAIVSGVFTLLSTSIMLGLCFYYSFDLALLALGASLLTAIVTVSTSYYIRKRSLEIQLQGGKIYGIIMQLVQGVTKLQVAGAQEHAFAYWARMYGDQLRKKYEIAAIQHYVGIVQTVIQTMSTAAMFYFAGLMVQKSQILQEVNPLMPPLLTVGLFFAFQGAFSSVIGGVVGFFQTFIQIHMQIAKRELVKPILEAPLEEVENAVDPGRLSGHVQLVDLSFRYDPETPMILNHLNMEIHAGEFIALVGGSGSGKSTVLKLILGFERPTAGQVLIDRHDTATLDMKSVRRQIGVVLQSGTTGSGTMYHAISGAANISMDDAWAAAEDAGLADDIHAMPMGMHSIIPEGGTTLSGGQKQRLMIARAIAHRPKIVIFDEATSALDNRTQKIVSDSLSRRKVTRIVVAHRLSTIMGANRIYVLRDGAVAEQGDYQELVSQNGMFARMAAAQRG